MFCYRCGTPNTDSSKFCINCGTQFSTYTSPFKGISNFNFKQIILDSNAIITIVFSVIAILSMLALPLFKFKTSSGKVRTLTLLGENYKIDDDIVTLTSIAFIFMLGAIIALVIFKLTKKPIYNLYASAIYLAILVIYDVLVAETWSGNAYLAAGNIICIGSGLALLSLTIFSKDKQIKQKDFSPPPVSYR